MLLFRLFLVTLLVSVSTYAVIVTLEYGGGWFGIFMGDLIAMNWPGQFNFDFMCVLAVIGLWVAWRHEFTLPGILLGLCGFLGGAFFLTTYLFVISYLVKGDARALLLGPGRYSGQADYSPAGDSQAGDII
ncbi:MAG: hypothetical protein P1V33_06730 [Pseudohongiella nitratireducens]|nr:hypothetical protein [Pseudohongiella nitratireducens]MDF1623144.1 hypothetical protein [Pseudohongiella nitratireducens]